MLRLSDVIVYAVHFLWLEIVLDVKLASNYVGLHKFCTGWAFHRMAWHGHKVLQHVCDSYVLSPIHMTGTLNYPPQMTQGLCSPDVCTSSNHF